MYCIPNFFILALALLVIAVVVGVVRWAVSQYPDKVDAEILKLAWIVFVIGLVIWILSAFCLFDNLTAIHRKA